MFGRKKKADTERRQKIDYDYQQALFRLEKDRQAYERHKKEYEEELKEHKRFSKAEREHLERHAEAAKDNRQYRRLLSYLEKFIAARDRELQEWEEELRKEKAFLFIQRQEAEEEYQAALKELNIAG